MSSVGMGVGVVTGVGGRKSGRPQAVRSATVATASNEDRVARVRPDRVEPVRAHIEVEGGEVISFDIL